MIPKINNQGYSFKGLVTYLMHDKEAYTSERVAWTHTENLLPDDPIKAAKVMAWTDINSEDLKRSSGGSLRGNKPTTGSVYHYSLSWAQDEKPSPEHMREHALETLKELGLEKHQVILFAHNDTAHAHVHVVANLTHPKTGKRAHLSWDQRQIQKWALAYEKQHGIKCERRLENAKSYENGTSTKHRAGKYNHKAKLDYSLEVTRAFQLSDNGKSFVAALQAEGLRIAENRNKNGFVIIDEKGEIDALTRHLSPIDKYHTAIKGREKTKLINERMEDIKDRSSLGDADTIAAERKAEYEQNNSVFDKELDELNRQEKFAKAAELHAQLHEKYLREEREKVLFQWRKDKRDLFERRGGLSALSEHYRSVDTQKEAEHRKHWQQIIDGEEKEKARLEEIRPSWLYSFVYKVRNGHTVAQGIKAQENNIKNAKMRLEEGVGGLTRGQKRELLARNLDLDDDEYLLEIRVNKELQQAEDTARIRAEKEHDRILSDSEKTNVGKQEQHNKKVAVSLKQQHTKAAKERQTDDMQLPSKEKWKNSARNDQFQQLAHRMRQEGKSAEEVILDEQQRQQALEQAHKPDVEALPDHEIDKEMAVLNDLETLPTATEQLEEYYREREKNIALDDTLSNEEQERQLRELQEEWEREMSNRELDTDHDQDQDVSLE